MNLNSGISQLSEFHRQRVGQPGCVVETADAAPLDLDTGSTPRVATVHGTFERGGRVAHIHECGLAKQFIVHERLDCHVRLLLFIDASKIDKRIHAKHIFLGVLPVVAAFPILRDGAHELKGNVAH